MPDLPAASAPPVRAAPDDAAPPPGGARASAAPPPPLPTGLAGLRAASPSAGRGPPVAPATPPPPDAAALDALRAEIDALDDAMHDLLMRRASVVARMAEGRAKGATGSFRPGREAAILRRLLARHAGPLPRAAVLRVWREVIASSLAQQGGFSVATLSEGAACALARAHFGLGTPLRAHPTPARALAALSDGEAAVAVLPAPEDGEPPEAAWWPRLDAPRLCVVAALPFLCPASGGPARPAALVVAALAPDPTGRDRSLLRLEGGADASRASMAAALTAAGLPPIRLVGLDDGSATAPRPGSTRATLAEVAGHVAPDDPRLARLPMRADALGSYAEPETDPS